MWAEWLSWVADAASIISLIVSGYAVYAITQVRRQIVGRVRLPEFIDIVQGHATEIQQLMLDFEENRSLISLEMAKCFAHLRTLQRHIREARTTVTRLVRLIQWYREISLLTRFRSRGNRDKRREAWDVYEQLNVLIEELRDIHREQVIAG